MLAFIVRRLASTVLVMGLVGVFIFLLLHLSPGDPAAIIAGDNATPEQIEAIRTGLGLNDPLLLQFVRWAARVLGGDLGISIFSNVPVSTLIGQRIWPTRNDDGAVHLIFGGVPESPGFCQYTCQPGSMWKRTPTQNCMPG